MLRLILGRIAAGAATLLVASALIFTATQLLPGDLATATLGRDATPDAVKQLRETLGLNRPAALRYVDWLQGIAHLDLGKSAVNQVRVSSTIAQPLRNSALLVAVTLALLIPLSLLLGTAAALRRGSFFDLGSQLVTVALVALPEFVVGIVLVLAFAIAWPVLPAVTFQVNAKGLVLPVATLLMLSLAYTARMVRAGVIEVLSSEYVAMARLKGMPERSVIRHHVLPNAIGPSLHAFALTAAWLAGGVVIVEYLFAYPGIGRLLIDAVTSRDVPMVEAVSLILAAVYVIGNLIADIATILLTPRLRTRQ
ncbi:MAG: peptide/nickel transport system permease protein [Gaiellales bacterium]|nr:peptide/nickel transport system permease protein [Gaiellales bacterium]MDX6598690.1 peptide/nickel transport system permease protein [Gaiellales bacterium]